MKITIIYDNEVCLEGLQSDWGFSCLVEAEGAPRILFDTGADGAILLHNMERLDVDPSSIDEVFISHAHWDHTGGLAGFLKANKRANVYLPSSMSSSTKRHGLAQAVCIKKPVQLQEGIFSTGELKGIEQSLAVKTARGLVIIVGCSHPGVGTIMETASRWGKIHAIIGGLHGFREFELLRELGLVCACHCTQFKSGIEKSLPAIYHSCGAGRTFQI
jgi:7,8-dihydropterin-6-yl-methyl-4-(beta-D-ribofuranosyl)aminobenzene 5'-phosphate synthase